MPTASQLYADVTATIIKQIENGVPVWRKPWASDADVALPTNAVTGRAYSGANLLLLWAAAERGMSNKFLTFKQANDLGGKVRKGERSTRVIFLKFLPKEGEEKQVPVTRIYNVFSVSQVDGLPDSLYGHEEPLPEDERLEGLRELVKASGIRVQYSAGTQPAYFPGADYVAMNQYGDYTSDDDFASTLFHEFTHATMHKDRLNRDLKGRMWPDPRAAEECVAELGAAFLCAHLGFDYVKAQSPAYIESWLKVLKADTRALFSLASHASHAADWLRERTHAVTDETPECERAA